MPAHRADDTNRMWAALCAVGEMSINHLAEIGMAHHGHAYRVAERNRLRYNPGERRRHVDDRQVVMYGRRFLARQRIYHWRNRGLVETFNRDGQQWVRLVAVWSEQVRITP